MKLLEIRGRKIFKLFDNYRVVLYPGLLLARQFNENLNGKVESYSLKLNTTVANPLHLTPFHSFVSSLFEIISSSKYVQ